MEKIGFRCRKKPGKDWVQLSRVNSDGDGGLTAVKYGGEWRQLINGELTAVRYGGDVRWSKKRAWVGSEWRGDQVCVDFWILLFVKFNLTLL